MIFCKLYRVGLPCSYISLFGNGHVRSASVLCHHFNIPMSKAEYISLKYPVVKKLDDVKIRALMDTLGELGYPKEVLLELPLLFGILPITIRFRHQVLNECAFQNISPKHIVTYLSLVKQYSIDILKHKGELPTTINIENRLASFMTQWPTSLTTLIYEDVNKSSLYDLRLKIIQRYLELVLDLSKEEFYRGVATYPTIKHRPLAVINETLTILQSQVMMPPQKIKSNLYLVHADPENLKHIIYKFQSIGGIDIKEILRLHPKIATKSYPTLIEIRKVLQEYGFSNEAQIRCFDIYTLSPKTIRERIEKAKTIPEINQFFNHPRFLKMIHYNNTAIKRLRKLYDNKKRCLTLNILSGSSADYETFEKSPGDRVGKGKDLIFCLTQLLGNSYRKTDLSNRIKKHPFWTNIPLIQVQYVYKQLTKEFSPDDIYNNCPILLYPWSKIRDILWLFKMKQKENILPLPYENVDLNKLSKSQHLSLVLYMLEKNHYFSGNGVWAEEKNKCVDLVVPEYVASSKLM